MPFTFCPKCGVRVEWGPKCSQCGARISLWQGASDEKKVIESPKAIEPLECHPDATERENIWLLWLKRVRLLLKLGMILSLIALLIIGGLCVFAIFKYVEEPPLFQVTESDGYYHIEYEWNYKRLRLGYEWDIPKATYDYFHMKTRTASYQEYVLNSSDDKSMKKVADGLGELAEGQEWGEWETLSFVLSFVQSMPYTSDKVTTRYDNYPRYPIETFVDGGGDCEDTAILFSSIVREMGYGVALLLLKADHHMAVGVSISQAMVDNWHQGYGITYYNHDGEIYAYCETTGEGWELGHMPEDLVSQSAQIIDVF